MARAVGVKSIKIAQSPGVRKLGRRGNGAIGRPRAKPGVGLGGVRPVSPVLPQPKPPKFKRGSLVVRPPLTSSGVVSLPKAKRPGYPI